MAKAITLHEPKEASSSFLWRNQHKQLLPLIYAYSSGKYNRQLICMHTGVEHYGQTDVKQKREFKDFGKRLEMEENN